MLKRKSILAIGGVVTAENEPARYHYRYKKSRTNDSKQKMSSYRSQGQTTHSLKFTRE